MNYSDIQHRFANKLEGKYGSIKAGNTSYEGRNYYSYRTIFGQWVDISKNVCVVFDGDTSMSSSKHKLWKGVFPDDVHVFPYDDGGGYYRWHGCNLVGEYTNDDKYFDFAARCRMIDYYVGRIYNHIAAINGGKKKGLENVSFGAWDYIEELCSLYKDTSIAKYIKWTKNKDYKKLVRMMKDGERNVEVLTDALFGEGTYKTYWNYCARYRKSADKRAKVEALCKRLGIRSPYEKWGGYDVLDHEMSADDIRKMTAKERIELHFRSLAKEEYRKHENERKKKYNNNFRNAYKWITGYEPEKRTYWGGEFTYQNDVKKCRNMYTGEEYEVYDKLSFGSFAWWAKSHVTFDYDEFRKSEDKEKWIEDFYAKCEEVAHNIYALSMLVEFNAPQEQRGTCYFEKAFVLTDEVMDKFNGCAESIAIVEDFIRRQDKHYADEEARRRAEEIARLKREEEERKEKEFQEKVKQEQIDECLSRGIEGKRDLWRKHLKGLYDIDQNNDFFMGGNVLLRMNLNKDKVETSKNIRIPVEVCKKMWRIVSKWHENPNSFKPMEIDTKGSGKYTISSYENDILTAGCHKIAYTEMERMYNEIININVA